MQLYNATYQECKTWALSDAIQRGHLSINPNKPNYYKKYEYIRFDNEIRCDVFQAVAGDQVILSGANIAPATQGTA